MKEILDVQNMHCQHCEMKVNKNVLALPGVISCVAYHEVGKVELEYDESKVSLEEIKAVITKTGFPCR